MEQDQAFFEGQMPIQKKEEDNIQVNPAQQGAGQALTSFPQGMMSRQQERPPITNELDLAYEQQKLQMNTQVKIAALQNAETTKNFIKMGDAQSTNQMLRTALDMGIMLRVYRRTED